MTDMQTVDVVEKVNEKIAALDAVEETLNLNAKSDKAQVNANKDKQNGWQHYSYKIIGFLSFPPSTKARLLRAVTSNVGITIAIILIAAFFIVISSLVRSHKNSATTADSGWGKTATAVVQKDRAAAPSQQQNTSTVVSPTTSQPVNKTPLQLIAERLDNLNDQISSINQRLMVISQQLDAKNQVNSQGERTKINSHYRILGWRLDQDTNQWIADIQYSGEVRAYYAGQHFGQWTVRDVTANGVQIVQDGK